MSKDYSEFSREELIKYIEDLQTQLKSEKYGLYWDKNIDSEYEIEKILNYVPVLLRDNEIKFNNLNNILIEGDNYHSLIVLNLFMQEKIDIIYIDPPYNTLINDFKYNDRYVGEDDGYKHSKWLSFMKKRLKLARELLNDGGVIFISIDDHEFCQLKLLCDEIFGESNFVACFTRNSSSGEKTSIYNINTNQDYVLFYVKNTYFFKTKKIIKGINKDFSEYSNPDNDPNGPWKKDSLIIKIDGGRYGYARYPIKNPYTNEIYLPPVALDETDRKQWHYVKETFDRLVENGYVVFEKTKNYKGKYGFFIKKYLKDVTNSTSNINSLFLLDSQYQNANGTRMLKKIFNKNNVFPYSKPVSLIKRLVDMIDNKNAIVLDFFAGSGTTGQAVLELNKEDGGNRRFILCTNNENNICTDVTYPRLKTVITGIRPDGTKYSDGIPTNLIYYKTDFIKDNNNTDQAKYCLVEKVDELLCINEDIFVQLERNDYSSHYISNDKSRHMFIYSDYYNETKFNEFKQRVIRSTGTKVVYIFSSDNNVDENLFEGINDVVVKPIPSKIYEIYKEIVEDIKRG